jgi:hypothetical protein
MRDKEAWLDGLWRLYDDNHVYVRHQEVQRSTVATAIITIASALLAVATFDKSLTIHDAPILGIVIVIGLFGIVFSRKQYERTCMHVHRADSLLQQIQVAIGNQSLVRIIRGADSRHRKGAFRHVPAEKRKKFRFFYLGMNMFWVAFYSVIALIGTCLMLIALFSPMFGA